MPNESMIRVAGWPPAKDGSKSISNPDHSRQLDGDTLVPGPGRWT